MLRQKRGILRRPNIYCSSRKKKCQVNHQGTWSSEYAGWLWCFPLRPYR